MTSSNGNIFRVTGPLCGEFTGDLWIPLTKASDAELWCFLSSAPEQRLRKQWRRRWFETHRAHYDITVMLLVFMLRKARHLLHAGQWCIETEMSSFEWKFINWLLNNIWWSRWQYFVKSNHVDVRRRKSMIEISKFTEATSCHDVVVTSVTAGCRHHSLRCFVTTRGFITVTP